MKATGNRFTSPRTERIEQLFSSERNNNHLHGGLLSTRIYYTNTLIRIISCRLLWLICDWTIVRQSKFKIQQQISWPQCVSLVIDYDWLIDWLCSPHKIHIRMKKKQLYFCNSISSVLYQATHMKTLRHHSSGNWYHHCRVKASSWFRLTACPLFGAKLFLTYCQLYHNEETSM